MSMTQNRLLSAAAVAALGLAVAWPAADAQAQAANRNIVIVTPDEPATLEPCGMDTSHIGRVVKQNIAETLTEIDPSNGSVKPRLALSWEKLTPTTWRFKLRDGVKFSDGEPFNAETAASSINRTMSKTIECTTRTRFFAKITFTPKAVDALTLDIEASEPVPILPTQMGVMAIVSPKVTREKLTDEPVGTGPYVFDSWKRGSEVTIKRNPNYWGAKPDIEQAKYVWRNESSVRASMVKIGEADFAPVIAPQDATDPKMDFSYLNSETSWLKIDVTRAPLDDRRVRLAMNYAIDRNALRGSLFPKDVIPATQVVIPAVLGHNHDIDKKVWAYDQAKARQLIAEAKAAGVPVDKEILIVGRINYYPNGQEHMEALMGMLNAVGLNTKLQMFEVNQWTSINRRPFKEDRGPTLVQSMHDNNNGDAVFSAYPRYGCEGISSNTCDPKLEELITKAATLSGPEREKTWQEAFRYIYEDMVADVNMFHMVGFSRVGPRIDFKPSVATNSEIQIAQMKLK